MTNDSPNINITNKKKFMRIGLVFVENQVFKSVESELVPVWGPTFLFGVNNSRCKMQILCTICMGLHNIQTNKYTNIQMAVYSERAALQKNKSSNDALALKARKRNITYA
jgi:hypothetical protein